MAQAATRDSVSVLGRPALTARCTGRSGARPCRSSFTRCQRGSWRTCAATLSEAGGGMGEGGAPAVLPC